MLSYRKTNNTVRSSFLIVKTLLLNYGTVVYSSAYGQCFKKRHTANSFVNPRY